MKASEFCYWLQGYFELTEHQRDLTSKQVDCVRKHLALVFKHEIDPSYGDEDHQNELNDIHNEPPSGPMTWRC
jgi:hypothetical protein